jgi:hypothetical protein
MSAQEMVQKNTNCLRLQICFGSEMRRALLDNFHSELSGKWNGCVIGMQMYRYVGMDENGYMDMLENGY